MRATLILAAAGSGERFRKSLKNGSAKIPSKLFFPLDGKPLLARTLKAFEKHPSIKEIIVAAPSKDLPALRRLLKEEKLRRVRSLAGGKTRAESVWKALNQTRPANPWILVHDGARPFLAQESLKKLLREGENFGAAILAKKVVPTLKKGDPRGVIHQTVDRSSLFEAETPQMVRRSDLLQAYRENPRAFEATDEASLVESIGKPVKLVEHVRWNPKITTLADLELAEAYLRKKAGARSGFGRDTHRLVKGRKFYLGGVRIPFEKGPLGHSDGDALLHAVCDALLGAAGAGDIGQWFSDRNPKFKNIPSSRMLEKIFGEIKRRGFSVAHLDSVVHLERPRLGPYREKIRRKIAALLEIKPAAVSVKAKTGEGLGAVGKGRAIFCEALVTLRGAL